MKRINLDLFELQVFTRLAELQSFSAAAKEVGLSGPALSRMIGRVETRVGARLFDRDTRNVRLTPQGEALRDLAIRILGETENALNEFNGYLAARRGRVILAGLPSVTAGLLPPVVARFMAQRPDVEIRINDALSDDVIAAVLDGRADIGFTAGLIESTDRLRFRPLLEDRFVAIGTPGYLAEDRAYTWAEMVEQPFIAMARGTSVRALSEAAIVQSGLLLRPCFEVSHLATCGALVAEGLGVSALPSLTLPVLGRHALIVRPLVEPSMIRLIGLVTAADRTLSPAAQAFHDLICDLNLQQASG
ncbi:LysR family transcriptional regulator [Telmatospirillum sp. J64-1]|uniref:LysR family transcriptional regulator n=1 Tax=Telmatospirillum sp. J64-1 TaxID=2502183 RepID=UPI00115E9D95|nr:LysR family transcriptional regulator [Telmatospirillum sp. J64-1]